MRATARPLVIGAIALVALIAVGNLAILGASWWAKQTTPPAPMPELAGVKNLEAVDSKLWRGGAPTPEGYRALGAQGVKVVVDLRAEEGLQADWELVHSLGMRLVRLAVRDGQVPTLDQVQMFLKVTEESDGLVFVHCGAGVGRTGAMTGAYLVHKRELNGRGALRRNLRVGTPTLEQLAFVARLGADDVSQPPGVITALSRLLDAPRRMVHNLGV